MKAEIISVGTELLMGELTDTNSSYLAARLALLGIDLYRVSHIRDDMAQLNEALQSAWQRSDLIITGGGLGPTDDDLTREAIAAALGEKLAVDPALEVALRARFAQWGMQMPLTNLRQATLIPSARSVPNLRGTAPGWWLEKDSRIIVTLPGPPREMQDMWQREIEPRLRLRNGKVILSRTIKTFGLPEAAAGERVFPLFTSDNPILGIYAKPDGIHLRLVAKADSAGQAQDILAAGDARIREVMGEHVWGTDDQTLEGIIGDMLQKKALSLALMEDYSGGWLAATFTDAFEKASFFKGSLVAGSDEARIALGVSRASIEKYGSASAEVASEMAETARRVLGADIGLATTAIVQTESRPMGVVYIGLTDGKSSQVTIRTRGKRQVTTNALFELRKLLLSRS